MAKLRSALRRSPGFSLVEVMVAMVIGLVGMLMMARMTESWEARKRSSAYAGDAQVSGSIALYRLEQDLRLAGYGFGTSANVGCMVSAYDNMRAASNFTFRMVPVEITDGGSGAPDSLTVLYGDSATMSATLEFSSSTNYSKTLRSGVSRAGIRRSDLVIAVKDATACGLIEITDNEDADGLTLDHNAGGYTGYTGFPATARYNSAAGLTLSDGILYNMGFVPRLNNWQIINDMLQSRNDLRYSGPGGDGSADWAQIAEGIVNLQAEYGLDTDNDTIIDVWRATPPPTAWSQVRAVRVALLARSQQYEKTAVTTAAPTWAGGNFVMTDIGGTSDTNPSNDRNWRNYRYRVYEAMIPLRNILWGTAP